MLLYNGNIHTMCGKTIEDGAVLFTDGIISKIFNKNEYSAGDGDINLNGGDLYPGFIDAHTHLGMIEDGLGFEGDDSNEETDPVTPQLRAIDAINAMDDCFREALDGGITTVVTGPGSANPVAGQLIAMKTYGKRVDDMFIRNVGVKFALGENPKTVYNDKSVTPITRMATAALIREAIFKAKKYDQDIKQADENPDFDPPEFDIKSESLLPLIRKEVKAHFHCHRADDIFTAIRIAKEFDIDYVIIHGTEGHLIADELGKEKSDIIVGPVLCDRSKPEMKKLSTDNGYKLWKSGVRIALCTDHPVIPVQYLPVCAGICVKAGLPYEEAIKAITINAAEIAGIDDVTGSIKAGKDADFVMFNGNPLEVMSETALVICKGKIVKNNIQRV